MIMCKADNASMERMSPDLMDEISLPFNSFVRSGSTETMSNGIIVVVVESQEQESHFHGLCDEFEVLSPATSVLSPTMSFEST